MVSFKLENMEATCGDHTNFIFDRGVKISLTPPSAHLLLQAMTIANKFHFIFLLSLLNFDLQQGFNIHPSLTTFIG